MTPATNPTVDIERVLLRSLTMKGRKYRFGAEIPPGTTNPLEADCSELVEWSCGMEGLVPKMPDGAYNQWMHCKAHQLSLTVEAAINTRGALLFVGDGRGVGRDAITHVAWSLGDGTTIEARGKAWGVGCWPTAGRGWSFGGLVPGAAYGTAPIFPPAPVPGFPPYRFSVKLGSRGEVVTAVQQRLSERGWAIGIDGKFGPQTDRIVRAFQTDKGLSADGVVGPKTWAALWLSPIT